MRRILITGASRGLGRELVKAYAHRGDQVVGVSRTQPEFEDSYWVLADLSSREGLEALKAALKGEAAFVVVIHNLGLNRSGPFLRSTPLHQESMFMANLLVPIELTQFLLAKELVSPSASFVFVNSMSHFMSYPGSCFYAATKDGLHSFARSLEVTSAKRHHFLQVYPGPMETDQAKENSPSKKNEKRLSPEVVAKKIISAVTKKKRRLIPGHLAKAMFVISRISPSLAEALMKTMIFDKMK